MAASNELALPSLNASVRFRQMPRRYEETKPVIVQEFTHKRILNLGHEIHRRTVQRCSVEKEIALRAAEDAVWAQAEINKKEALEKAIKKANNEHDKVVRKLFKAQERAIKTEALRVEGEMQQLAIEQVQQERADGERRLQLAVKQTENRCHLEKIEAIAVERKKERQIAAEEAAKVAKANKEKFQKAMAKAAEERSEALQCLEERKEQEKQEAVVAAHKQEQAIAAEKHNQLCTFYEQQLRVLRATVEDRQAEINGLEEKIHKILAYKEKVENELMETRDEFELFIERVKPFQETEPNFVIPPMKSVELT